MDDFLSLFGRSLKKLGKSPVLFIAGLAVGVLALPLLSGYGGLDETIRSLAVDFSQLLVPLLLLPFIAGGALGYAAEIHGKGKSSLSTFISSALKHYPKLVLAGIIAFVVYYILITGILVFLLAGMAVDPFLSAILGVLVLGLAFLILMAIEFYDISIVAQGAGVLAGFRNSIDFVKRNLGQAVGFFVILLVLKALIQLPLSFGLAGAMMTNETYYNALMAASNATYNNSTAVAANSSVNMTSLLSMNPVTLGTTGLIVVGLFQVLLQGFIYALITLYKTEMFLTVRSRKKITDFDYDFSEDKSSVSDEKGP